MERGKGGTSGKSRLVTVTAGARELGIGTRQLRRAIKAGELAVYDVGSWPRLAWSDLLAWVERQRRGRAGAQSAGPSRAPERRL